MARIQILHIKSEVTYTIRHDTVTTLKNPDIIDTSILIMYEYIKQYHTDKLELINFKIYML